MKINRLESILWSVVVVSLVVWAEPHLPQQGWFWGVVAGAAFLSILWVNRALVLDAGQRSSRRHSVRGESVRSERLGCMEVACLCAGVRFREGAASDARVDAWLERLIQARTILHAPVERHTELALAEWLFVVRSICSKLDEPLPRFFRRFPTTV